MKRVFALSIILAAVAVACSKSKFETVPTVEIKSLSPDAVGLPPLDKPNAISVITLKARVTDKEGDVKDSVLIVPKYFLLDGTLLSSDTVLYKLDVLKFPDTKDIEIQFQYSYGRQAPGYEFLNTVPEDQNFAVGMIVIDREGNRSEYVESAKILLLKP
jgi:hypothetical protein